MCVYKYILYHIFVFYPPKKEVITPKESTHTHTKSNPNKQQGALHIELDSVRT